MTDMTCDQCQPLLSAHVDGETRADERAELDAHLAGCAACRDALEEMRADDASVRAAFDGRRAAAGAVAERAVARLGLGPTFREADAGAPGGAGTVAGADPRSGSELVPTALSRMTVRSRERQGGRDPGGIPPRPEWSRRFPRLLVPLLAAAAGFAVAWLVFRPGAAAVAPVPPVVAVTAPAPVAHLALATGRVDVRPPGSAEFFACPTGGPIAPGTAVRTGPRVRCELRMADGSDVRLNDSTEVTVRAARRVELASGQMFSAVAPTAAKEQFVVRAAPADVSLVALGTEFDVSCAAGDRGATLTVVEGAVRVDGTANDQDNVVKSGEAVTLAGGSARDRRRVQSLAAATQWVDEILVLKGRDNPELARRLNDLLGQLGQQKMQYLGSQELRRLGDHCVVPLARYIQSAPGQGDAARRREAARIIADVATTPSIPELINLLADADGEVRFHAAQALHRLTGQSRGRTPEQWRDQPLMTCAPTVEQWHAWWARNKDTLPGADPDAVRPFK